MPQHEVSIERRLRARHQAQHVEDRLRPRRTPSGGSGAWTRIGALVGGSRRGSGRPSLRARRTPRTAAPAARPSTAFAPRPSASASSRSVSRHDGSRPTIAMPASANGSSASMQRADALARLVDMAAGQERPAAAVVAAALVERVQGVAGGLQHARRGERVLALEDAVEGVDEEDGDLAGRPARRRSSPRRWRSRSRRGRARRCRAASAEACAPRRGRAGARRARRAGDPWRRFTSQRDAAQRMRVVGQVRDSRSFSEWPCRFACWARNSIFMRAMSTPVGHSRLQPLQRRKDPARPSPPRW